MMPTQASPHCVPQVRLFNRRLTKQRRNARCRLAGALHIKVVGYAVLLEGASAPACMHARRCPCMHAGVQACVRVPSGYVWEPGWVDVHGLVYRVRRFCSVFTCAQLYSMTCVCVCVCVCLLTCMRAHMCACMNACVCEYAHEHVRAHLSCVHACVRACARSCLRAGLHACNRTHMCACMLQLLHACVRVHTPVRVRL